MTTADGGRLGRAEDSRAGESRLVTTCGRSIEVRHLRLGRPDRPVGRIALAVGEDRGGEPGVWAALTPQEARGLARMLLVEARAMERSAEGAFSG
ncbi:hypothetical protein A6P39_038615 [Streptomyces sp. FXJ1.172]|jgi:hypothetical protein|uniref:hypothetical protein n=1 Tax=Streptomyces sp. FXJ1.172 TaxID=710705 RepID=UPI0007CFDF50|nr:hypothetical protein [Streptomyces sp. FXJ1.172]WEO99485.1 hypothetical protein A6P39_038615 [Streptomyces sp. FXJ1.172]